MPAIALRPSVPGALLLGLVLAGCAGGEDAPRTPEERVEQLMSMQELPTVDVSARLYTQALELKATGNCTAAIPPFYSLASRGDGYELAQYHLATCLLGNAEPSMTSTDFLEGLLWLRRSAEAGAPDAQGELARLYVEGPPGMRNLAEAALWYELYLANPAAKRPGFSPMPRAVTQRLDQALPDDLRAAARERTRGWRKTIWRAPDGSMATLGESDRPRRRPPPGGG